MSSDPPVPEGLERLQQWIGLVKFLAGTFTLGLVSLLLNYQYQNNQLALEREKSLHAIALQEKNAEFEYLSSFMEHAMNEDLAVRIRLADYMKSAALSESIQNIWQRYHQVLLDKQNLKQQQRLVLQERERETARQLTAKAQRDPQDTIRILDDLEDIRKEIYYLQDELDRRKYGSFEENYINVSDLLRQAENARLRGEFREQLTLLEQAGPIAPDSLQGYVLSAMASAHRSLRNFPEAERFMKQAVALSPVDPRRLLALAIMEKNNGALDRALTTLQEASAAAEGTLRLNIELVMAGYEIHAGRRDQGMQRFSRIRESVEAEPDLVVNLAWFRAVAGPEEEFYRTLERALILRKDTTLHWIAQDVDLDPYRDAARFQSLVRTHGIPGS